VRGAGAGAARTLLRTSRGVRAHFKRKPLIHIIQFVANFSLGGFKDNFTCVTSIFKIQNIFYFIRKSRIGDIK
jgi:hypothetical protein